MQSQIWMVLVTVKVVLLGSCLPFELTILHTNDVRSRFESFNSNMQSCSYEDIGKNQCYGGAARMTTAIKRIRQSEANVLLLDAGDQFQGSAWYTLLKWHPLAKLMNALQYDAMTLGNREFNDWLPGLIPFMSNVQFPVLSSNIESDSQEFMQLLKKYIIIDVGVEKVGIVGYTTTQKGLFVVREPTVEFNEELPAVRQAVNQLRQLGVNKIIALGHSGLAVDKAICEQVEGVDIVVGAHDDTFLYTGSPPIDKKPGAPYPVVIDQQAGGKCIIVQDERYGKFLGYLKASFDSDGKLVKWSGNPILIDSAVAPDAEVAALLQPYQNNIGNLKTEIVATAATSIDGTRTSCRHAVKGRKGNCTAGSLIADAHRRAFLTKPPNYRGEWTRVNAAIMNSRGIRGNLFFRQGATISMDDLYSMTPFQYKIQRIPSPGSGATFDVKAFLCYYYYGGLIYSMLKRFDRALFFFEMVLTMPAVAVSQIAVETYKKYLLVSLIHLGKLRPLPKYKPTVLGRFIKPACGSYNDLLAAYGSQQLAQLESVVSKNSDIYAQDSNTGLVKQVVLSMKKRNILRLTKTFVTLSLADVAHRCHLGSANEAEKCILYMIDAGEISATIDQQNGMVQFHDDSQHFDATETAEEVQKQLEQCIKLEEQLAKLDTDLLLNPQFVSKMLKLNQPYGAPPFNEDEGIGTSLLGFGSEAMQMN